jgi:tRNA(fMet)-specific endonuclease VapC
LKYLLDSNTCIGWLRLTQPNLVTRIKQEIPLNLVIRSVVVAELIYGAEWAAVTHQANNRLRVAQLRQQFVSLPFDDLAAEEYGKIRAHLTAMGKIIDRMT